ncbi:hypothetical protein R1sor_018257 [Riccia sorocarpa]|uniref:DNA mismatch repair protein MSH3 n=1 Tax=Riccia sorocarpa TaxID=122646 RepID=A0ABD3ICW9_9MARC
MKKQQIISRFFSTKPTSSASSSTSSRSITDLPTQPSSSIGSNSAPPPPAAANSSLIVEWPPRTSSKRKNLQLEELSPSRAKRRAVAGSGPRGGASRFSKLVESSEDVNELEFPPVSTNDIEQDDIDKPSSQRKLLKIPGREDAQEFGGNSDTRKDDEQEAVPEGEGEDRTLPSEEENFPSSEDLPRAGDSVPSVQRRRKGRSAIRDIKPEDFPASDPAKHKKFVEKLLVRTDARGELEESGYRESHPKGQEKYTPLEMQVVELKAKYPDVVLMVEVGYRYRFFGNDAETAAKILGIFPYYDHNFLTASIPTFRLHVHVRRLVEAGCKVGVVRQQETAAIKAHGANKAGPFIRGLSALYTRATLEAAENLGGESEAGLTRVNSYLMCVAERPILDSSKNKMKGSVSVGRDSDARMGSYDTELGVVAVETSTGDVMFSHFKDTVMRTELEGRLLACTPVELLLATPLSTQTEKLLMDFAGPSSEVRVERTSRDCFEDGGALAEVVDFYKNKEGANLPSDPIADEEERVDKGLEAVLSMPDIVVQALCLAVRYLKQFGLENVLRLGASFRPFFSQQEMNLSPNALRQLEILKNNADGTEKGSLLWLLDQTQTAFGARLLRHWVTHPLCDHDQIAARLDAVSELAESIQSATQPPGSHGGKAVGKSGVSGKGLIGSILTIIGRMPDLERGITRIFHRTATAGEFVTVLEALATCAKRFEVVNFASEDETGEKSAGGIRSSLLKRLTAAVTSKAVCEHANRLLSLLNLKAALKGDKHNIFNCEDGRFPEILTHRSAIEAIEKELLGFLPTFRKILRKPTLEYKTISGNAYLVEATVAQRVPGDWIKVSGTKTHHRYHPPEVSRAVDKLALATERLDVACKEAWDKYLEDFSSHYLDFRASVQALAALDCLYSLAVVSRNQGYTRPEFVGEAEPSQLIIKSGRHPVLDSTLQERFVPNDTTLHAHQERCQIITGPNMGGKSCYIRQVALIAIMAQMGSFVPASSAKLHVFDSVYTRMGASDSLQKGSSTFLEELSEASSILKGVSSRSLVIIDELGRGTSTHDGVALAYATLHHLLKETQCLTLFVTHYPKIAELALEFPGVVNPYFVSYLSHEVEAPVSEGGTDLMAEDSGDLKEASRDVTFLYKLVSGVASRSFGLYVARLAQIPRSCVISAASMASKLEKLVSEREGRKVAAIFSRSGVSEEKSTLLGTPISTRFEEVRTRTEDPEDPELIRCTSDRVDSENLTGTCSFPDETVGLSEIVKDTCTAGGGQSPTGVEEKFSFENILQEVINWKPPGDLETSRTSLSVIQRYVKSIL